MKNLVSLLTSRKFWLTAIGVVTVICSDYFGLSKDQINDIVQLISILVGGITGIDIAKNIAAKKEN